MSRIDQSHGGASEDAERLNLFLSSPHSAFFHLSAVTRVRGSTCISRPQDSTSYSIEIPRCTGGTILSTSNFQRCSKICSLPAGWKRRSNMETLRFPQMVGQSPPIHLPFPFELQQATSAGAKKGLASQPCSRQCDCADNIK